MASHRAAESLKHPPAWVSAFVVFLAFGVVGTWLDAGPIAWLVGLIAAVAIIAADKRLNRRNKNSRS